MTVESLWIILWIKESTDHTQGIIRLWVSWFSEETTKGTDAENFGFIPTVHRLYCCYYWL